MRLLYRNLYFLVYVGPRFHVVKTHKQVLSPLLGEESLLPVRYYIVPLLICPQKHYLLLLLNPSFPQNLDHKIFCSIIIPIFNMGNQEVKATEVPWWLSTGDKDSNLWLKTPILWLSSLRNDAYTCIHWKNNIFQVIHEKAEQFLLLPWKNQAIWLPSWHIWISG